MLEIDNEIPKYKKKASKTVNKSKHKHIYEICLIYDTKSKYYYTGTYCTVCGKIGTWGTDTKIIADGRTQMLSQEELKVKYKDFKIKEVHNILKTSIVAL